MSSNRRPAAAAALALAPALLLAIAAHPASGQASTKDWEKIPKPPLHKFEIPRPKKVVFANGLTVFLMEDRELPLIDAFATSRGGSRNEPAEKAGLARIFGEAWRTGGTAARTGDQLDDFLEARAAKVETTSDIDSVAVSLSCLKGDFDEVLAVFEDVLRRPEFRAEKIALAKTQLKSGIARRNDNPQQIAERVATSLGYGPESPYARVPEYATVDAVTREDLLAWHKRAVQPDRTILSIVGDFDTSAMEAKLRKTFGGWPRGNSPADLPAAFRSTPAPGVYFVAKDDVNQSNIRMVAPGIRRDNPDYFAVEVMNEVLGGGFSSRLFSNVRSKKGLAYAVGGGLRSSFDHPGLFRLTLGTKSETTAAGIDALLEEVQNISAQPPSDEEIRRGKEAILNSFIFRFDSKEKVLREQAGNAFYGYPPDFLERYRREIEKVTAADVARVAKKYVHKEDLAILVVGKAADFDRPLSSFGKVTPVDITIPSGTGDKKAAAAPVSAGARDAGRALFAKVVVGLGGAQKVAAAKNVTVKGQATVKTPQGELALGVTVLTVFPDKLHMETRGPFGEITMVLTPQAAFMAGPQGIQDLPASAREDQAKDLSRSALVLAQRPNDPKLELVAAGKEKIGEVEAAILDVNYGGTATRWFVDPSTGRILRASFTASGGQPGTRVIDYSDFRTVDGLVFAFKQEMSINGEKARSTTLDEVKVNTTLDPTIFEKPNPK